MKRTLRRSGGAWKRSGLNRRFGAKSLRERNRLKDNLKKLAISIAIILVILLIKNLEFSLAQKATGGIRHLLTREYDFKKGMVSLKELGPALRKRVQDVFNREQETGSMTVPVEGPITSRYGVRVHPVFKTERNHDGIDIGAPIGEPVRAALAGTVEEVRSDGYYGKVVIVSHADDLKTLYGHLGEVKVAAGQQVGPGDIIGLVGNTGMSTGSHLHFEVWRKGKAIDPAGELRANLKDM